MLPVYFHEILIVLNKFEFRFSKEMNILEVHLIYNTWIRNKIYNFIFVAF